MRRLVGHPDHAEDIVQDALLKAFESIGGFRGDASFSTWLCTIGTRTALDHLRKQRTWRVDAQVFAQLDCVARPEQMASTLEVLEATDFRYDVREHIAFCFSCVGRSLSPDRQAVLLLRDVLGFSNREAADMLGLTQSVLRHHLTEAREGMQARFDHLCALVSKDGVCYQCAGLRDRVVNGEPGEPATGLMGAPTEPREARFAHRLKIVQDADIDSGHSQPLHDLLFRQIFALEEARTSDALAPAESVPSCGWPAP